MQAPRLPALLWALAFGLLLALGPAHAQETLARCSWDRPGHNPFMGDVVAAVDRYADIPADVRQRLKARMAGRQYDDLVVIRRDSVVGQRQYEPAIRDMHFGAGSVCREVTRARWHEKQEERGLVFCDSGHCVLVPTVCRNVSRIVERPQGSGPARTAEAEPDALLPGGLLVLDDPLEFEPPAAGGPSLVAAPVGEAQPGSFGQLAGPVLVGGMPAWRGSAVGGAGPVGFAGGGAFGGAPAGGGGGKGGTAQIALQTGPFGGGGEGNRPATPEDGDGSRLLLPDAVTPVPETATVLLLAAGLAAMLAARARQRRVVPACNTQKRP
ncbi:MHFG family PEP-CTERM protein [Aquabacterium sp. J223]|uniref:MHFG family PEP-CTERM protein n=1 Tax=Aquabacterium sp. J223 TaxID=2898431 RepID=UPI0021AE1FBC|nr:MHFG family PEP-CTERM protein [Aquabacterium sp. J223]UUX96046.1 MHFG family PEP-CTERM protein [Aquabacterium sp. J223]